MKFPTSGVYAITQTEGKADRAIVKATLAALKGGAAVIQYRHKNPRDVSITLAQEIHRHCQYFNVPLLINDNIELAHAIGAEGVHLGQNDASIETAQTRLGPEAIIGVSCYDSLDLALKAQKQQISYVAFGRFFCSESKPQAPPAQFSTLTQAAQKITLPIVAIGGILPSNGHLLLNAGADVLAVIGGIFDHDPFTTTQHYCRLFNTDTKA
jgi:thiamine-phosphate pyrophosphorylase